MTSLRPDPRVFVAQSGEFATIGPAKALTGLFQSTLDLPGGLLTYDVRGISAPPCAEVTDPGAAVHWVARVYGASAAGQLGSSASEAVTDTTVTTDHAYTPDASAANLARVALGQWLWRFWPATDPREVAPLDEVLLRLELAALAWQLDDYFTVLQPASTFLDGALETLHELANRIVLDPSAVDRPLGRVVVSALDAAVAGPAGALVSDDESLLQSLDDLLTGLASDQPTEAGAGSGAQSVEAWLTKRASTRNRLPKSARKADYALTAGGEAGEVSHQEATGRSSVDWIQVPPRYLDWNEDTVSWRAERLPDTHGSWRLTVWVAASTQPEPAEPELILARVYVPDGTELGKLPVASLPLVRIGDDYIGSVTFRHGDLGALAVDVFSASSVRRPVIGRTAREDARREREHARQFIIARALALGTSGDGPDRRFEGEPHEDV